MSGSHLWIDRWQLSATLGLLASALLLGGDKDGALLRAREALAVALDMRNPDLFVFQSNLAHVLLQIGTKAAVIEAVGLLQEASPPAGPPYSETPAQARSLATAASSLGATELVAGQLAEALDVARQFGSV